MLIVSLMIMGVGVGFTEALINPLVVDIHPDRPGKYLNITNAFFPIGVMSAALLFGQLLNLGCSWRLLYRLAAAGALAVGVAFSLSRFPAVVRTEGSPWKLMRTILGLPAFWVFAAAIFLGAGIESAFTFWSRSYVAIYLRDLPRAGSLAVVIFAAAMAAGRLLASRLSRKISLNLMMTASACLGLVVSGMVPLVVNLVWFYALLALAGIAAACFWPTILAAAAEHVKLDSTILFVLLACAGIAGFGLTPWTMGIIGDRAELSAGFFLIPGFFLGLLLVLALERRLRAQRLSCQV